MKSNCSTENYGFTLVELLVVISIISILAGAAFMIINPAQLQRKAKEASLKATVTKVCASLFACASIKSSETDCDSYSDIGILNAPTEPNGASFSPPTVTDATNYPKSLVVSGSYTTGSNVCTYTCSFNFSDGSVSNLTGSGCL